MTECSGMASLQDKALDRGLISFAECSKNLKQEVMMELLKYGGEGMANLLKILYMK